MISFFKNLRSVFFISLFVMVSCSTIPTNNNSKMNNEGLHLPSMVEKEFSNGAKVIFIKDSSLPRLSIVGLIKAGALQDPVSQRGLNYLTASLLDEGTQKHNSSELAERMEFLGGDLSISPGADFTTLSVKGLSYTKTELMDSFFEVLLTPQFPDKEISRLQRQVKDQIQREEDEPDQYTNTLFAKMLFGRHPYGYPIYGTTDSLTRLKRKDLIRHYLKYYRPSNTLIAVSGDIDDEFIKQFETRIQTWIQDPNQKDDTSKTESAVVNAKENGATIYFQSKKSLIQSQIRLGQIFVERNHPDYLKLRLANMALGGAFASRLNQKVRDDLALTYGIHSYFDARKQPGFFMIDTFSRNEKVGETIQASLNEFKAFQEKGMTESELQAAKSVVMGQFPRAVETLDMLTFNLLVLRFYGVPDSYLTQFNKTVQSYKLEEVNEVIRRYFQPQKLQVVVFGEDKVLDQLKKISEVKMVPKNWKD